MANEKTKTIKFNLDKQEERELWEWLQTLPHGIFSDRVKHYWFSKMEIEKASKEFQERMRGERNE